ncbi:catalase [Microvirga vignae]|uniref:catalase n=1 Tax=Microvirga vignae TaxID=1225564 RepID=UPI000AF9E128
MNRQGHPITNNQSQRTVGARGPATLENYQFLKKITHFDRERIPERVVHARGFVSWPFSSSAMPSSSRMSFIR